MEQLQSSGILELVHYMTQQSVSNLTGAVSSSGNEPSEFQKELEEQTKAVKGEVAEIAQQPKPKKAEENAEPSAEESESVKQTLEAELTVMQQLIASGVVNMVPVSEDAIPQEVGVVAAAEVAEVNVTTAPAMVSEAMTMPAEEAKQPNVAEQMPAAPNAEQSEQPVETVQEQTVVQEKMPQAELSSEQGEMQQDTQFTAKTDDAPRGVEQDEIKVTDAAEADQTLFGEVKEIPVKVGETQAPKQTERPASVEEQVETKLSAALMKGESKVEIQLTPDYLGTIKVELTRSEDGTLNIVLSTENSQTGTLLEKHSSNLQNLLMAGGQERVQIEVHTAQEHRQNPEQDLADGHNGGQHQERHQERREEQTQQDFLQQLRLGLIPMEEAS